MSDRDLTRVACERCNQVAIPRWYDLELVVRRLLYIMPVITFIGMTTTALFSAPTGPGFTKDPVVFKTVYAIAAATTVYWGWCINKKHLKPTIVLGLFLTVFAMFRSFTVFEARKTFGSVAYSAVGNWQAYTITTLCTTALAVAYILVTDDRKG